MVDIKINIPERSLKFNQSAYHVKMLRCTNVQNDSSTKM